MQLRAALGRVGIWTRQLDGQHGTIAEKAVGELEALGYGSVWIPEAVNREVISHTTALLASTTSITIATGIARVQERTPHAAALAQRFLADRFPWRFVLGLGVSHPVVVEGLLGKTFEKPLTMMSAYLDAMDATVGGPPDTADAPRVLAAYAASLEGFGFDDDVAGDLSDRLVEALVAIGDVDAVVRRVEEHLAAGADHVCVEVLTGDDTTVPLDAWRRLAPALTTG